MGDLLIGILACIGAFNICKYLTDKFMKWLDNIPQECPKCLNVGKCNCDEEEVNDA